MSKPDNFEVSRQIRQTVNDATDLSQGSNEAALRLQSDVYQNYQKMSSNDYNKYIQGVTDTLKASGAFDEVAAAWVGNNKRQYDTIKADGRLDKAELNNAIQTSRDPLETAMLLSVRDQYQSIKHAGGEGFMGIRRDSLKDHDFEQFAAKHQDVRDKADAKARSEQQSSYIMTPLLATEDGIKDHSLFNVLDNMKGGSKDGKVSKGDLKSFVDQYDRAALNGGDIGEGVWTRENRDYAKRLVDNWDKPEVVALRGTHREGQSDVANSHMTEKSLAAAAGYAPNANLYSAFRQERIVVQTEPEPVVERKAPPEAKAEVKAAGPSAEELAAARAKFEEQVRRHMDEESHYSVKPGQGFDRIARDVIKKHSDDDSYKNEVFVEQYSDKIAKMNGRNGRLDKQPVLHPNDSLKVFDDAWVDDQIQKRMKVWDEAFKTPEK